MFNLPYSFRDHGPKHISRSLTAKNWKWTTTGKFDYQSRWGWVEFEIEFNDYSQTKEIDVDSIEI